MSVKPIDRRAQEDLRAFVWTGAGIASLVADKPVDLRREINGELSLVIEARVDAGTTDFVGLAMLSDLSDGKASQSTPTNILGALRAVPKGTWATIAVPLRCLLSAGSDPTRIGSPFALVSSGKLALTISDIRVESVAQPTLRCP